MRYILLAIVLIAILCLVSCGTEDSMGDRYDKNFEQYQKDRIERLDKQQAERRRLKDILFDGVDYDNATVDQWYENFAEKRETAEALFKIEGCNFTGPLKSDYTVNTAMKAAWKEFFDCEEQ